MPGWKTLWTMRIEFSRYDVRVYSWIVNEKGESAFVWIYGSRG